MNLKEYNLVWHARLPATYAIMPTSLLIFWVPAPCGQSLYQRWTQQHNVERPIAGSAPFGCPVDDLVVFNMHAGCRLCDILWCRPFTREIYCRLVKTICETTDGSVSSTADWSSVHRDLMCTRTQSRVDFCIWLFWCRSRRSRRNAGARGFVVVVVVIVVVNFWMRDGCQSLLKCVHCKSSAQCCPLLRNCFF